MTMLSWRTLPLMQFCFHTTIIAKITCWDKRHCKRIFCVLFARNKYFLNGMKLYSTLFILNIFNSHRSFPVARIVQQGKLASGGT